MTVAALAGRRVDAPDSSSARFPLANVGLVRVRIRDQLERLDVHVLVCSAACGADLLALAAAGERGIRRRAILPTDPTLFRRTSVVDRPGDWGPLFDGIIADLRAHDDLKTLETAGDEVHRYFETNTSILEDAVRIGAEQGKEVIAMIVWDGESHGERDATDAFGREARARGLRLVEISTLADSGR